MFSFLFIPVLAPLEGGGGTMEARTSKRKLAAYYGPEGFIKKWESKCKYDCDVNCRPIRYSCYIIPLPRPLVLLVPFPLGCPNRFAERREPESLSLRKWIWFPTVRPIIEIASRGSNCSSCTVTLRSLRTWGWMTRSVTSLLLKERKKR